jgi:ribosomal protein S18 acetylase RimI-like enzyme
MKEPQYKLVIHPIDYTYLQPWHIKQVNALLSSEFWDNIDISECLEYTDYSIVAMYRKMVVGGAFMTPEGYISYVVVHPEWRRAGIANFMLYHLLQLLPVRDITLHVSVNNPAMILYQKFGFKMEEFIVGFYDKYYASKSQKSTHAFFLRSKRYR